MTAAPSADDDDLLTIDELAASAGLTVRTTRYYVTLGLLPPPVRRGRMAYYGEGHRARLELVRALQDHGFTLQAIEGFMAHLPADASPEDLALQRTMLTSWSPQRPRPVSTRELVRMAGRKLSDDDLELLVTMGALVRDGDELMAQSNLPIALELLDVPISPESMLAASEAVERHMSALVADLNEVFREAVVAPLRDQPHTPEDAARVERTVTRLRQLTLDAVVTGFQRAADAAVRRSIQR